MDWQSFVVEETKAIARLVTATTTFLLACLAVHVIRHHSRRIGPLLDRLRRIDISVKGFSARFFPPRPRYFSGHGILPHRDMKPANILIAAHHGSHWYM